MARVAWTDENGKPIKPTQGDLMDIEQKPIDVLDEVEALRQDLQADGKVLARASGEIAALRARVSSQQEVISDLRAEATTAWATAREYEQKVTDLQRHLDADHETLQAETRRANEAVTQLIRIYSEAQDAMKKTTTSNG